MFSELGRIRDGHPIPSSSSISRFEDEDEDDDDDERLALPIEANGEFMFRNPNPNLNRNPFYTSRLRLGLGLRLRLGGEWDREGELETGLLSTLLMERRFARGRAGQNGHRTGTGNLGPVKSRTRTRTKKPSKGRA